MTIKQIYLFRTTLVCTVVCSFACYANEIKNWRTELCQNIPELSRPEKRPVLIVLCNIHFRLDETRTLAEQTMALNDENLALVKTLPLLLLEQLTMQQSHHNRLLRREVESADSFATYSRLLTAFSGYQEVLAKINCAIPNLLSATDLMALKTELDIYLKTCDAYDDWCRARKYARLSIGQKLNQWFLDSFM